MKSHSFVIWTVRKAVLWCESTSSGFSARPRLFSSRPIGTHQRNVFKGNNTFDLLQEQPVASQSRSRVRGSSAGHKPVRCGQRDEPRWAEPGRWWPPGGWAEESPAPPAHTAGHWCLVSLLSCSDATQSDHQLSVRLKWLIWVNDPQRAAY